ASLGTTGLFLGSFATNSCSESGNSAKTGCKIIFEKGEARIKIGNEIYQPLAFRSFRPEAYNIRDFYDAGIRIMSILHAGMPCTLGVPYSQYGEHWNGIGEYDFSKIDDQMKVFMDNAPEAYFNIKLMLDTRPWHLAMNPEYVNSYRHLSSI